MVKKLLRMKSFWLLVLMFSLAVFSLLPNGKVYPNGSSEEYWLHGSYVDSLIVDTLHLGYPTDLMSADSKLYNTAIDCFYIILAAFSLLCLVDVALFYPSEGKR